MIELDRCNYLALNILRKGDDVIMIFKREHVDINKHVNVIVDMILHIAHVQIDYFDGSKSFIKDLPVKSNTDVEKYANNFCY